MAQGDYICIRCKKTFNNSINSIGTGICPECLPAVGEDYTAVLALKAQNAEIPEKYKYLFSKTEPAK